MDRGYAVTEAENDEDFKSLIIYGEPRQDFEWRMSYGERRQDALRRARGALDAAVAGALPKNVPLQKKALDEEAAFRAIEDAFGDNLEELSTLSIRQVDQSE